MENWEIPYFEGMQSVKMPVLTTTGKNLWYSKIIYFGEIDNSTGNKLNTNNSYIHTDIIELPKYENLVVSCNNENFVKFSCYYFDENKNFISCQFNTTKLNIPDNAKYFRLRTRKID